MSQTSLPDAAVLAPPEGSSLGAKSPMPHAEEALDEIRAGRLVVVVDDGERTGTLMMAAERANPRAVDFMVSQARGPLRVSLPPERLQELRIPVERRSSDGPSFCAPVGLRSTGGLPAMYGASASACAVIARALCDPRTEPSDLVRPGHVYPVGTRPGNAFGHAGPLEAGLDLALAAGCSPAALVCGILDESGEVARLPAVMRLAARHGLKVVSVKEAAGLHGERRLRREIEVRLPTRFGDFRALAYTDAAGGQTHLALVVGEPEGKEDVLAYVHRRCLAGDNLRSLRCCCGLSLEEAMARVQGKGVGVIVYARAEPGRTRPEEALACRAHLESTTNGRENRESEDDQVVGALIFEDLQLRSVRLVTEAGRNDG